MSLRAFILAVASIAVLAVTALAPTRAFAMADGSVRLARVASHAPNGFLARVRHCRPDPYKS